MPIAFNDRRLKYLLAKLRDLLCRMSGFPKCVCGHLFYFGRRKL
jgi:hypothetical protein